MYPIEAPRSGSAPRAAIAKAAGPQLRDGHRTVLGVRDGGDACIDRHLGFERKHLLTQRRNFRAYTARF